MGTLTSHGDFRTTVPKLAILALSVISTTTLGQSYGLWGTEGSSLHLITAIPGSPEARWKAFLHLKWNFNPPVQVEQVATQTVASRQYVRPTTPTPPLLTIPSGAPAAKAPISTALPEWYVASKVQAANVTPTGYTSIPITTTITTRKLVTVPTRRFEYGISFVRCAGHCW
jgi:hypothetical protein